MNRIFDVHDFAVFSAYSLSHIIALSILVCLATLLYIGRHYLKKMHKENIVRFILIATLVLSELSLNVWYIWQGRYDVKDTLPLELCSVSLYLCIIMLIWKSRWIFQIVYFTGLGGAVMALLTPALDYAYPHFRFIEFFAAHIAIILSVLYMVWIEQYRPTLKSVFITMGFLNILLIIVGSINWLTGGNYMFLAGKPTTASLLDILGPYPWYLISLEIVALLLFMLLYIPFFRKKNKITF